MSDPHFIRVLKGQFADSPPVWLMRQAGRYLEEYRRVRARAGSFLDLCYSPKLAAEVTLQPVRRFGFDAAILFSDILVVPHALGQTVEFRDGEGPVLEPVTDGAGIATLRPDGFLDRLAPVFEAVERVRGALDRRTALIGFCGAPWTVATYMAGGRGSPDQAAARLWAYRDPASFLKLIDLLVEVSAGYLCAQIDAGAQAVQIFDSWAGNLPDSEFRALCVAPTRRLVRAVKERNPDVPVIGFPRGAGPGYRSYLSETRIDCAGCDTALPLAYIRDELQTVAAVQGNLDPLLLKAGGRVLDERIAEILETLTGGPFVFNLGHGILPDTPVAHVERLVERVRG